MKAFVTAEFSRESLQNLKDLLQDDVVYESWRETRNLYFDEDNLIKRIKEIGAEILICEGDNVKKKVIEETNLKIIGSTRGDPNNIDVESATKREIPILFAPDRNTISVAELTVSLILSLARNLHSVERILHSEKFEVNEFADYVKYYNLFKGNELSGKIVGIIGLGRIGFEVAKRLLAFNVKFLIFDPYVIPARLNAINGQSVDLDILMAQSDIISLHCPPTDETDDLIGAEQIALMKKNAIFINLARASVIDEYALLDALKEKKIAGAALDVFSSEPVDQDNEFLELDNVIVTPHIGGDTYDTNHRHAMMMIDGISRILHHQIPKNIINPEVLSGYNQVEDKGDDQREYSEIPITLQMYSQQIQEIIDVCKKMIEKEYIVGSAGNVSMRIKLPTGEEAFLVTPSNVEYGNMVIDDIVMVDANGDTIVGTRNPTSERRMHLAIFREREDIDAIIHSHAPYSTALSIARMPIGPIVDEVIPFIGGCEVAEYGMAGSDELANNVVKALGKNLAVFMANHGNVCCGRSISQAWTVCRQVEMAAKIQHKASLLGTIYALPEEAEEAEKEIYDIMRDLNF